ncbi:MAG: endolytic transglycosylase MltG [Bacteroidota bacterium]
MRFRILLLILLGIVALTLFVMFRPMTQNEKAVRIQLHQSSSIQEVADQLTEKDVLSGSTLFLYASRISGTKSIRAGSYLIKPSESLYNLMNQFRKGLQTPVKLILGNERVRLRTTRQLAAKMQRQQYSLADSTAWSTFLQSNDSLRAFSVDTFTVMSRLLPLTYEVYWTDSPKQIFEQINKAWLKFWNKERTEKSKSIGLNPTEVCILASIVEEETQHSPDRPLIASTYLNRLRVKMPLQADPTAKFGSGDLDAKRVTFAHLRHESPYNTYLHSGLPPGPICLPSIASIDAVLNAPQTDYLYFVASHRFDGTSVFTKEYTQHLKNAKLYQTMLTKRLNKKANPNP